MTDPYAEIRPWFRRRGFVAAAAFLAVVLVVGAVVVLWPRDSGENPPPAASPSTATSGGAEEASESGSMESICGLPAGNQEVPTIAPEGASWDLFGTFAAPSIEGIGPGLVDDDGLRHCFAHSPTGALLAAINVSAMTQVNPNWNFDERLAADTRARELLAQDQEESPAPAAEGSPVQVAGFSVDVRSPDDVTVTLVYRATTAELVAMTVPLRWEGGDWKVVLPDAGSFPMTQVETLSGYVEWSGA